MITNKNLLLFFIFLFIFQKNYSQIDKVSANIAKEKIDFSSSPLYYIKHEKIIGNQVWMDVNLNVSTFSNALSMVLISCFSLSSELDTIDTAVKAPVLPFPR